MNNISLRRASVLDAHALAEMEKSCFSDPWSQRCFESFLLNPASHFYIAEKDGIDAAYAGMTVVLDECDIINIAVLENMRRLGIGRILMRHLLKECSEFNVKTVFLEHRLSNIAAAALYDSLGFTIYDIRRNYYTSPREDAVLRRLTL